MPSFILNLADVEFQSQQHGDRFEARLGAIGTRIGARKLGYRLTAVPPGKRAWPLHSHLANEEMFFVLEGAGIYRVADKEYAIRQGDFIAAPAGGAATAHQIINTSKADLKYLCVSTMAEPDVMLYPDSDKFGVYAGAAPGGPKEQRTFSFFGSKAAAVDYWERE